jgi:Asp-tRNA(Asn)/Glu-tRNA(Gln) amidotransferase B subunit
VLLLSEEVATAAYFDACVATGADPVQAANWIQRDIMGWCKEQGVRSMRGFHALWRGSPAAAV